MRIRSLFLACLMMLVSALPAMAATFDLGTVNGTAGAQVTVPVTLTNAGASIAALSIDIGYDTTKLSVPMNTAGTAPLAATRGPAIAILGEDGNPIKNIVQSLPPGTTGVLRLGILNPDNTIAIGDGVVVNVKFNVLAGASGTLVLTNTPGASSPAGSPVTITGSNGQIVTPAAVLPTITAFSIPATGNSLTIPITTFTASNATAYLITESATAPAASAITATTIPTTFTVTGYTAHTLYAWAKNASGVVSAPFAGATTTLTPPAAPLATVTAFAIPATGTSLTIPITTFTASNAAAYLITESATAPTASAITATTIPTTFTVTGYTAHTLYAWVKNSDGVVSVPFAGKTITLTEPAGPDLTPPTLTITSPPEGMRTKASPVNIAGTVSDASGIKSLTVNGTAVTPTNGAYTYPLVIAAPEGDKPITVVATDNANNTQTVTRTIVYDITPMTITVTAPADNSQTKDASITVSGTVAGVTGETGTVEIKNTTNNTTSTNVVVTGTNYTGTIALASGSNGLQVTVTDPAGNKSTAVSRTVLSDPNSPALAITDPAQDVLLQTASATIKGTVSDATTTTVKLRFNGVDYPQTVTAGAFQQAITIPAEGTFPVVVTASDAVGNPATSVTRNIIYTTHPTDSDADGQTTKLVEVVKAFQYSMGLGNLTDTEKIRLDCAPLGADGKPSPNGVVDGGDVILLLRRVAGLVNW